MLFNFTDFGCITDVNLGLRWDPADFASEVLRRTGAMVAADIEPGSTVGIAHLGSAHFFADLFAVWTLGCTAACIDPALTENEIETLVEFVQPSAVLVGEVPIGGRYGAPTLELTRAAPSEASNLPPDVDPNSPALILFTSGTTGHPKGVIFSFRAILTRIALNRIAMGHASRMKTLITLPTSFGHGLHWQCADTANIR